MRDFLNFSIALSIAMWPFVVIGQEPNQTSSRSRSVMTAVSYPSQPRRLDGPLRQNNISDAEVLEIEGVLDGLFPGAILNISGVTSGCPCEDGPDCVDQVWIVAHRKNIISGVMLSKIDEEWTVGPIQSWWLRYEKLIDKVKILLKDRSRESWDEYFNLVELQWQLIDEAPKCVSDG